MPQAASTTEMQGNCVVLTRYFFSVVERPDAALQTQLTEARRLLQRCITKPLSVCQYEALLCLASDIAGDLVSASSGSFDTSFLVSALNKGMFQVAVAEFHTFCYDGGRVNRRAWNKRKAEQYLFTRGELLFD